MNPMKRLVLAVLLVLLGGLRGASPALAGKNADAVASSTSKLVPPETDPPEPKASGRYTVEFYYWYPGFKDVTVSCKGLTPQKQYDVVVLVEWYDEWWYGSYLVLRTCTADKNGKLDAQVIVDDYDRYVSIGDLWVENDEGSVVLERVP